MRRHGANRWLLGLGALALHSMACAGEVAQAEEARRTIAVPQLQAQLEVPASALVEVRGRWVRVVIGPGRRAPELLEFGGPGPKRDRGLALAGDPGVRLDAALGKAVLRGRIEHRDGGSGGPEAALTGQIAVGPHEVEVFCSAQDEDHPSLRWCLRLLQTLRPLG
ncbi:hypothetical protein [Nannocystis bainbridge]|uniref:Type six secretion immunity 3 domain-containing protein n=1 Tax=Nannocystis bainbridge TaxID=2995303 RepID=A0ABT5E3D6_9BACT|nr:hypothetical protein [Nannocystis bainbridge]MDC0719915.1 hypothetical protein [Nannocystis bainbridge]